MIFTASTSTFLSEMTGVSLPYPPTPTPGDGIVVKSIYCWQFGATASNHTKVLVILLTMGFVPSVQNQHIEKGK